MMPGKKAGGGGGAGGKTPGDGSSARHPPPPSGPPGSSHPAGGSPSNTRVSHNTEAVPRDADLGTVGKHGLRRSTSNSNCEAVLRDAGLGAVEKHGHRSSTSNISASPRSGGMGATSSASPRSDGAGATKGSGSPPRSVRMERKARADKLQSLLYPHPDKLADFKSSVGGDLQPHRLFTDIKFRDTWMQFEKNPTGQLREKLHKMAASLHKRWYEKSSNTTKSKSNCAFNTRSTKRKDHSFDTGTAPTSAPPGYKIPRKGQSPVTPQATAAGLPPPAVPTFERTM